MAKANPFRFSTKYQDDETDLLYYGYRYYNASAGRWISRDPQGEQGSASLYLFCGNDALGRVDRLGLKDFEWKTPIYDPNHPPVPWPGDEVQLGSTSWNTFEPIVKVYRSPTDCCYKLMFEGNFAQLKVWWVQGDEEAKQHELHHITQHFYPAYLDYKSDAKSYFATCRTRPVAECLAGAIAGALAQEYKALALAIALDYDCRGYGGGVCAAAAAAADNYFVAAENARAALTACLSLH